MEHALSSAHDSAYSPLFTQFPRTKITVFAIFRYRATMRLMQTVLYTYVKLNIWCLRWRHSRRH